jgi:hypothetical protein
MSAFAHFISPADTDNSSTLLEDRYMPHSRELVQNGTEHQPTLLETQLDSISLMLGQMKAKVQRDQILDHMTSTERAELQASLARAEGRFSELIEIVRGTA